MKILRKFYYFILIVAVLFAGYFSNFETFKVEQTSMMPNIEDGQDVLCLKHFYRIKRFDVIIFETDKCLIKRVIGLPNETIKYVDNNLYVDGEKVSEDFISDYYKADTLSMGGIYLDYLRNDGVKLEDDQYFVLGDNRAVSYDSRYFGPITKDDIIGKVIRY